MDVGVGYAATYIAKEYKSGCRHTVALYPVTVFPADMRGFSYTGIPAILSRKGGSVSVL